MSRILSIRLVDAADMPRWTKLVLGPICSPTSICDSSTARVGIALPLVGFLRVGFRIGLRVMTWTPPMGWAAILKPVAIECSAVLPKLFLRC